MMHNGASINLFNMPLDGITIQTSDSSNDENAETFNQLTLSLFCGCGGLDLGFEQAGFKVGLAYDLRAPAVASHNAFRKSEIARVRDVTELSLDDLDNDFGGHFAPKGVIGGPPCQSFSRGNSSKSDDDPRKMMVEKFFDIALLLHQERSPLDFIVMENVPEVAKADDGRLLDAEVRRLHKAGFDIHSQVYNASEYGVAQRRRRLILVAINRKSVNCPWKEPEKCPTKPTVRDAIFGLPEPIHFNKSKDVAEFPAHPNHWCMTPKSSKFSNSRLTPGKSTGRSFKTLGWDKPSYTVSYGHREVHVHPSCTRRLSVFEAMLLQGFPRDFVLHGTLSAQFSQVSEAVPPPLGRSIAASIRRSIYAKKLSSNSAKADAE